MFSCANSLLVFETLHPGRLWHLRRSHNLSPPDPRKPGERPSVMFRTSQKHPPPRHLPRLLIRKRPGAPPLLMLKAETCTLPPVTLSVIRTLFQTPSRIAVLNPKKRRQQRVLTGQDESLKSNIGIGIPSM